MSGRRSAWFPDFSQELSLHETRLDSIRYTPECDTVHGPSGSPVMDDNGEIGGINNTGNDTDESCTLKNPCEVDENGNVSLHKGLNYASRPTR
jgi:V8-like Glu-specific endopeptidase